MVKPVVKVQTWGTAAGYALGVRNYLSATLRAENLGHASIELQLPVTHENERLINQYCNKIPHHLKTRVNADGEQENMYVVRFSFVPGDDTPFNLHKSYEDDCEYERAGHQTTLRHALEVEDFPERRGRTRNLKVFQASTLTPKGRMLDFHTAKGKSVLNTQKIRNLTDQLKTAGLLRNKLSEKKSIDKRNAKDTTIFLAANALNLAFGEAVQSELALHILEQKVVELELQLQRLRRENRDILLPQLIAENEFQLASALMAQDQLDGLNEQSKKIEAYFQVLVKMYEIANKEGINKEEMLTAFSQLFEDNPVVLHFEREYEIINYCNNLQKEEVSTENTKLFVSSEVNQIIRCLRREMDKCIGEIDRLQGAAASAFDPYLCTGRPPDGEVVIPLNTNTGADYATSGALHLESMLQQMQNIAESEHKYNVRTNNCSSTTLSILNAGKDGQAKKHTPASWYQLVTPQMVFNTAVTMRNTYCKQSPHECMLGLEHLYAQHHIQAQERSCNNLHEAIMHFAVDTLFPDESDVTSQTFYRLNEEQVADLEECESNIVSTQLLHDLWGIIPERNLPLVPDGSVTVAIDHNLTMGDLIQGLTVLAENNVIKRLSVAEEKKENVTRIYKQTLQELGESPSQESEASKPSLH